MQPTWTRATFDVFLRYDTIHFGELQQVLGGVIRKILIAHLRETEEEQRSAPIVEAIRAYPEADM